MMHLKPHEGSSVTLPLRVPLGMPESGVYFVLRWPLEAPRKGRGMSVLAGCAWVLLRLVHIFQRPPRKCWFLGQGNPGGVYLWNFMGILGMCLHPSFFVGA